MSEHYVGSDYAGLKFCPECGRYFRGDDNKNEDGDMVCVGCHAIFRVIKVGDKIKV